MPGARAKERGGYLILPWPNTVLNVRKVLRELRAEGYLAEIEKTAHETYVWTNAPHAPCRRSG